jgi:hypothetical protein
MHEALHLLPRVLGLQLHGLTDVLAFRELHGERKIRLGASLRVISAIFSLSERKPLRLPMTLAVLSENYIRPGFAS